MCRRLYRLVGCIVLLPSWWGLGTSSGIRRRIRSQPTQGAELLQSSSQQPYWFSLFDAV